MTARLSPLQAVQQAAGLAHQEQAGWLQAAASTSSILRDCSHDSNLQLEGEQAGAVLQVLFGVAPAAIGAVAEADGVSMGQLTATRYSVRAEAGRDGALLARLSAAIADRQVTVTNQTEGLGGLHIGGDAAAHVMGMLCGLDFSEAMFPVGAVRMSSFAKVRATIWHMPDGYRVYAGRSYLVYLNEVVRQAQELAE